MESNPRITINKLNKIGSQCIKKGKYEKTMEAISASAHLQYEWNQEFCDNQLEDMISLIGERLFSDNDSKWENAENNVILYYDSFGHDTRGLSLLYVSTILSLGYKVIYITRNDKKNRQPIFDSNVKDMDIEKKYINTRSRYIDQVIQIKKIVDQYKPKYAFLYLLPYDVPPLIVFSHYDQKICRFMINLTDHAFWLGKSSLDYCIEFRDYGYNISTKYRGIEKEKEIVLPYRPYIDTNIEFEGYPFDICEDNQIIFSGGALYKTIGAENKYYKIVERILEENSKTIFLYAGKGDSTSLDTLSNKYPGRIYHIDERKDLYQLLRHIDLYLNTYPVVGGLMMQYAAMAGKLPVTLRKGDNTDGILLNQDEIGVVYSNEDDLVNNVKKLLENTQYREEMEKKLCDSVISEEGFKEGLRQVITFKKSIYNRQELEIDVKPIQLEYRNRFDESTYKRAIAKINNRSLFFKFPQLYISRAFDLLKKYL